ncbi:MAG: SDR family oxidoreductase [Actinobacteria bacterium]|nr:SDR family oxidoreductase [Actinomycetota bacterium]
MTWAVVTGASGDIGQLIAQRLAEDGHDLVLHTFRRLDAAERTAASVRECGRQAEVVQANFAGASGTEEFAAEVTARVGAVDVLVSNAASGVLRPVGELTDRHLDWTFAVNVRPLRTLATAWRPRAVVALTSPGSHRVVPAYAAVGASKAALEALVRYLAVELAPQTRVNAVSAGLVDTRAARRLPDWPVIRSDALARTPLGRLVTAEDVARVVSWLASADSTMVTGATLAIDGGRALLL